jgi:hypothetical protein
LARKSKYSTLPRADMVACFGLLIGISLSIRGLEALKAWTLAAGDTIKIEEAETQED